MVIKYGNTNRVIKDYDDWKDHYKKGIDGHSAWEFGRFIMNKDGLNQINQMIDDAIGEHVEFKDVRIERCVKHDEFNHPSQRDMVIEGRTKESEKSVFITIEAKVDETFGPIVKGKYKSACDAFDKNNNSKCKDRVEFLYKKLLNTTDGLQDSTLRYQLFHATAATAYEKHDYNIMMVLEIRPGNYELLRNHNDFRNFMEAIKCTKQTEGVGWYTFWIDRLKYGVEMYTGCVKDKNDDDADVKFLFVVTE